MGKAYNALGNTYSQTIAVAVNSGVSWPVPQVSGVAPASGLLTTPSVAPGSLVSIYGSALAGQQAQASTVPLPNALGNVSVTFNGIPAPLLFVTGNQINARVPWNMFAGGSASGTTSLGVRRTGCVRRTLLLKCQSEAFRRKYCSRDYLRSLWA